jgi:hypothetical protein
MHHRSSFVDLIVSRSLVKTTKLKTNTSVEDYGIIKILYKA